MSWKPIETAPKDGSRFLAYGMAVPELAKNGRPPIVWDDSEERVPFITAIQWTAGWYDNEIDNGDGTYRKERTLGYSYWGPDPRHFCPSHWMPLPPAPSEDTEL